MLLATAFNLAGIDHSSIERKLPHNLVHWFKDFSSKHDPAPLLKEIKKSPFDEVKTASDIPSYVKTSWKYTAYGGDYFGCSLRRSKRF
ncbi:MAG: hypothetical protein GY750_11455 [Lentisphaerae bacterium]|nr:hypothetical protein [Lentisphaerota bacterium]MCP4102030.1 hypothetical protein [Lentisphaerota bacterium]